MGDRKSESSLYTHFAHTVVSNKDGQTPLSLASAGGHLDTVKYLVEVHDFDPRGELTYNEYISL